MDCMLGTKPCGVLQELNEGFWDTVYAKYVQTGIIMIILGSELCVHVWCMNLYCLGVNWDVV